MILPVTTANSGKARGLLGLERKEHALNLERGQGQLSHIGSWANVGN